MGLGGSWAPRGFPWAPVGHLVGASWAHLGRSWAPLGCSWAPLGRILPLMDASGLDFGALGARFRTSQGSISDLSGLDFGALYACVYILHELLHETHLGIHLGFSFPPCSAAVRAQHIRRPRRGAACWTSTLFPPIFSTKAFQKESEQLGRSGPLPLIPPRRSARTAARAPKSAGHLLGSDFFAIFCFPESVPNLISKKHRKNCENQ